MESKKASIHHIQDEDVLQSPKFSLFTFSMGKVNISQFRVHESSNLRVTNVTLYLPKFDMEPKKRWKKKTGKANPSLLETTWKTSCC